MAGMLINSIWQKSTKEVFKVLYNIFFDFFFFLFLHEKWIPLEEVFVTAEKNIQSVELF